jgi:putative nucleotidyltransferase with HDIG domain
MAATSMRSRPGLIATEAPDPAREPVRQDGSSAGWAAAAFEAALRARAPGVYASTPLVCQLARRVGRELGLDGQTQALLEVAVRVRDIGMVALPDSVVLATTPLSPADWELVNRHSVLGAQLVEGIAAVASASGIVRAHHERWDGGGYPDGCIGEAIPLLSRVIATCDAFVAIASDRPYRTGMGAEAALELVCSESGSQFDPATVDALTTALADRRPRSTRQSVNGAAPERLHLAEAANGRLDLRTAIAEFDVVPALAPAQERVLAAAASDGTVTGELVAAVESDTGLTVAVLRHAQALGHPRPIANVADAVVALGAARIAEAVKKLPLAEFPWRTTQLDVLMHRSLVHAQAVARAADRIARELRLPQRDDVLIAALLHDIGKLVLGRAIPEYTSAPPRNATPEDRVRLEQRAWGMDHASLGGLLLRRWGLPARLARTVAAHHTAEAEDDVATFVRLADMVAHHAQGEPVDRGKMLGLAELCGLSATALRDILFDLPHSGGSRRRRAEPSPLSKRETAVLRILAEGKVSKVIASELGVSASTVRTHLNHAYSKLGVSDRAQAVLRAAEMGWI